MFGNVEDEMSRLVKKRKWDKVQQKAQSRDAQTRLAVAKACAGSRDEESPNVLITLLKDSDPAVQLQAVKSLGEVGSPNVKTHLMWLSEHIPQGGQGIAEAIHEAAAAITTRSDK